MRRMLLISIGAGDPEHITIQAVAALNQVDVLFVLDKGDATEDLLNLRKAVCDRYIEPGHPYRLVEARDPDRLVDGPTYGEDVADWHRRRTEVLEALIEMELPDGGCGGLLVWGDPAVYDSNIRLMEAVNDRGRIPLSVEVIPGVGAATVLAARHGITLNQIGGAIHITTGRRLRAGLPDGIDDVVVMLDSQCSFAHLEPTGWHIYWGAYLGTPDEILIAGPLAEVAAQIQQVRAESRARKGWLFDTYLLRRTRHPM